MVEVHRGLPFSLPYSFFLLLCFHVSPARNQHASAATAGGGTGGHALMGAIAKRLGSDSDSDSDSGAGDTTTIATSDSATRFIQMEQMDKTARARQEHPIKDEGIEIDGPIVPSSNYAI